MPSTEGFPSSSSLSHIISGSVPARRWRPVVLLELGLHPLQVPAAVRGEERAAVLALLAVAEADAPDARDARIPGEGLERLRLGYADELGGLRPVPDVVPVAVGEEVGGGAVDELESLLRDRLPVLRRDALAHDAAGDGGELVVDVLDPLRVDPPPNLLDGIGTSVGLDEALQVGRHHALLLRVAGRSVARA